MICGIGTDIVEIARIKKAGQREAFLRRVFSPRELAICRDRADFFASLAVRFAAKEAVLKALGSGLSGCSWQDIEVLAETNGKPTVELSGGAAAIASRLGAGRILISLSHSRETAVAFCVAEGRGDGDVAGDR